MGLTFACLDCGVDTGAIDEYYMLRNDIWAKVAEPLAGMLCIGCVETRLGRRLGPGDFTWAPINDSRYGPSSARLRSRVVGPGLTASAEAQNVGLSEAQGFGESHRRASALGPTLRSIPNVAQPGNTTTEEVDMSASAITVEATTAAITAQWPEAELVEKKAYHRIAVGKLTIGYTYIRGQRPAFEVVRPDGKYDYISVKTKADLTKAINAMKAVEARAAKKATAAAKAKAK